MGLRCELHLSRVVGSSGLSYKRHSGSANVEGNGGRDVFNAVNNWWLIIDCKKCTIRKFWIIEPDMLQGSQNHLRVKFETIKYRALSDTKTKLHFGSEYLPLMFMSHSVVFKSHVSQATDIMGF